jgi:uncharacterized protein
MVKVVAAAAPDVGPVRTAPFNTLSATSTRLRLALISDTHGFIDRRIVELIDNCDAVVHVGDIGNRSVLRMLRPRRRLVLAVRGNNDTPKKWPPAERRFLLQLPQALEIALPGGLLVVVHGDRVLPASTRHERLRRVFPLARAVVYGHTHRLIFDQDASPWVLNPGAAGRERTFGGPSCVTLDVTARTWRVRMLRFGTTRG